MNTTRASLRGKLLRERRKLGRTGFRPYCDFCGGEINHATGYEMHEVIITKGEARGWEPAERELINAAENCVLLHGEPCHRPKAKYKTSRDFLTRKLLAYYGLERILRWLDSLPAGTLVEQKIHYVKETT